MFPHFLVAIADLTHPLSNNRSSVRIIGCFFNISLPERYICAKGQDTQVSAAGVLIKDKPIPNVFQYRTNCLNATPMFEYRATGTAAVAMT